MHNLKLRNDCDKKLYRSSQEIHKILQHCSSVWYNVYIFYVFRFQTIVYLWIKGKTLMWTVTRHSGITTNIHRRSSSKSCPSTTSRTCICVGWPTMCVWVSTIQWRLEIVTCILKLIT